MAFFVWIFIGLIVGSVAAGRFHHAGSGLLLDIALGMVGAVTGGIALSSFGFPQTALSVAAGLLSALAGSIATLACHRAIFRPA